MKRIDGFSGDKSLPHPSGDPGNRGKEGREGGTEEPGAREGGEARKTGSDGDTVSRKHWLWKKNNVANYNVSSDVFVIK